MEIFLNENYEKEMCRLEVYDTINQCCCVCKHHKEVVYSCGHSDKMKINSKAMKEGSYRPMFGIFEDQENYFNDCVCGVSTGLYICTVFQDKGKTEDNVSIRGKHSIGCELFSDIRKNEK